MKKIEIQSRRTQTYELLKQRYTLEEIAEIQNVHRNTAGRDATYLRKTAQKRLDALAKDDFVFHYILTLDTLDKICRELWVEHSKAGSFSERYQLLKAIQDNRKLYIELLGGSSTVHAFKRTLGEIEGDSTSNGVEAQIVQ